MGRGGEGREGEGGGEGIRGKGRWEGETRGDRRGKGEERGWEETGWEVGESKAGDACIPNMHIGCLVTP